MTYQIGDYVEMADGYYNGLIGNVHDGDPVTIFVCKRDRDNGTCRGSHLLSHPRYVVRHERKIDGVWTRIDR